MKRALVIGATGFVGRALLPALVREGWQVRATTRDIARARRMTHVDWIECDVSRRDDVERAVEGVDAVFYLVHGMGAGARDYAESERRAAERLRDVAARAGVKRIVYLGAVAPTGEASEHLKSRLRVGEILRAGKVPTIELRASMIVGAGSASWQIVRDLAMRLPAMILPAWTASRTRPVAQDDVIVALVRALDLPLRESAWFDLPGPDTLSAQQILKAIAAINGRRVPAVPVPFLTVSLSSWWLKLVTRADFSLARELVLGFTSDLLPRDDRYWSMIGYSPKWSFESAARAALAEEAAAPNLEERIVQLVSPKLSRV